jgi:hypothetical protein
MKMTRSDNVLMMTVQRRKRPLKKRPLTNRPLKNRLPRRKL